MVCGFDGGLGWGFGMGYFGFMIMALFWVAIIWLIVWLISQNRRGTEGKRSGKRKRG